jgi:ATP-dependent helicase/nuclease subunit A
MIGEHASEVIAQPTCWEKHQEEEAAYVKAEETRLLYVAATRAREMLVVTRGASDSKGRRCWQALDPFLVGAPELTVPTTKAASGLAKPNVSTAARKRAAADRTRRLERLATPSWDITSMTGGEKLHAEENTGTSEAGESHRVTSNDARTSRADAGAAWGSLVHGLMEHAARHPGATREEFEQLARWLVFEAPELEPVLPQAVDVAMQLVASSWWSELRAQGALQAEVPFAVRLEPGQSLGSIVAGSRPTIVQGVIDLAHRAGLGWRILDYKTDLADDDAGLVARHRAQLDTYRAAWERATAQPVTATAIVAVRKGKVVTV